MAHGIILRLTHAQRVLPSPPYRPNTRRESSLLIDDITDQEHRRGLRLPAQYVPYQLPNGNPGFVDLPYTSLVARSFELGDIRGLLDAGDVVHEFLVGETLRGSIIHASVVEADSTPHVVGATTAYVLVNPPLAVNFTVTLPEGSTHQTGVVTVKDKKGMATVNTISVFPHAGETIEGLGQFDLTLNGAAYTFVWSDSNWSII